MTKRKASKPRDGKNWKEKLKIKRVGFFALFRFADRRDRIMIGFGILFALISGLIPPLHMKTFGVLSGEMVRYGTTLADEVSRDKELLKEAGERFMDVSIIFTIQMIIFAAVSFVTTYLSLWLFVTSQINQVFRIRSLYFYKALKQDIGWYDVNTKGNFATSMSQDIMRLEDGLGEKCPLIIYNMTAAISCLILAFVSGWLLTIVSLTTLPCVIVIIATSSRFISKYTKKESETYAEAGAIAEQTFSSIRTVVTFGGQKKEIQRYEKHLLNAQGQNIKRSIFTGINFGLLWLSIFLGFALTFWVGISFILQEEQYYLYDAKYNITIVITVLFSVVVALFHCTTGLMLWDCFDKAKGVATQIFAVIDSESVINKSKDSADKIEDMKGEIVFNNVSFHYPSRPDVEVLRGLNLTILPGQTVAFVGDSGCGKTTCLQLLLRFYDPIDGQILLDGRDIRDLDLIWYRSNFGVVGQEPVLFTATIAENIRYGNLQATQEEIEAAARKSNADRFIRSMPNGYETVAGGKSPNLSGGQKQRIAIARTLVRNPSILLLDEPTSALDDRSEYLIQIALEEIQKTCTTIIVAHRMSTIKKADVICFLAEGVVAERGNHSELMSMKGRYYNMVVNQNLKLNNDPDDDDVQQARKLSDSSGTESLDETVVFLSAEELEEKELSKLYVLQQIMKLSRPEWFQITIGSICSILVGTIWPIFALYVGIILEVLSNPDKEYVSQQSNLFSGLLVLIGILNCLAVLMEYYIFGFSGEKLVRRLRTIMFTAMLRQEMGWYDEKENSVGALCVRLSEEPAVVQMATGRPIGIVLQAFSMLGVCLFIAIYYQWKLGLVVLGMFPIIIVAYYYHFKLTDQETLQRKCALERSTNIAIESISNVKTVASLNCEDAFYDLYMRQIVPQKKAKKNAASMMTLVVAIARSSRYVAAAIAGYYGGYLIVNENVGYGSVFKVTQALILSADSIANAFLSINNIHKGLKTGGSICKLINRMPDIRNEDDPSKLKPWRNGDIKYTDLSFAYPTRNYQALKFFNFTFEMGKTVALVGPSGCGKSTVIQLLQRFYDPSVGSVEVEGVDLRDMDIEDLRRHLGVVSQEPNLFNMTIAENIAYGDNSRVVDLQEIVSVAKDANIHNFIAALPEGYDTMVGTSSASQLSGGQKQRIAIARALLRNPQVLLLDEATSALDAESEMIVQEALELARVGRTCITIAHRLGTIRDADVICVLKKGRLVEYGNHDELMALRGIYYDMVNEN